MFHVERRSPAIEIVARGLARIGDSVLVCRSLKGGHCYLPGGHVEFGESTEAALIREFQEEAGHPVRISGFATAMEQRFVQRGRERHELSLVFHVELQARTGASRLPQVASLEPSIAFEWIDVDRLAVQSFKPECLMVPVQAGKIPPWITVDVRLEPPRMESMR